MISDDSSLNTGCGSFFQTGPASASHGDNVSYDIDVTYTPGADGSPATDVVVTDDHYTVTETLGGTNPATNIGDTDGDGLLDGGETWEYVASGTIGALHANGNLDIDADQYLDQCMSGSSGISGGPQVHDDASCPAPGTQPAVTIPQIEARDHFDLAVYVMCPNGLVRVGPSHPSWNGSAGDAPCLSTHSVLNSSGWYRGWLGFVRSPARRRHALVGAAAVPTQR